MEGREYNQEEKDTFSPEKFLRAAQKQPKMSAAGQSKGIHIYVVGSTIGMQFGGFWVNNWDAVGSIVGTHHF